MRRTLLLLIVSALAFSPRSALAQGDWSFDAHHAGKLSLGMSVDQLYSIFGRENVRLVDLYGEGMFNPAVQIYLPSDQGAPVLVADLAQVCGQSRVARFTVHSARFRTAAGIGLGSFLRDVTRAYRVTQNREEGPSLIAHSEQLSFGLADELFADSSRVVAIWTWAMMPDSVRTCR